MEPDLHDSILHARFWEKVSQHPENGGCWTWLGSRVHGYGHFRVGKKIKKAHRLVYESIHGEIPDGMVVMHSCDNRACVHPGHLSLGSPGDNNADRDRKGRQKTPLGEAHGMAKLRFAQAQEIKKAAADFHRTLKSLADKFGVGIETVRAVASGKTWNW